MSVITGVFPWEKRGAGLFDICNRECLCYFAHCFFCWCTNMSQNPLPSSLRVIPLHMSYHPFHWLVFFSVNNKPSEFIFSLSKNLFLLLWRTRCVFLSVSVCTYYIHVWKNESGLFYFLFACWCFFSVCCCKCECCSTLKIRAHISSVHQLFWGYKHSWLLQQPVALCLDLVLPLKRTLIEETLRRTWTVWLLCLLLWHVTVCGTFGAMLWKWTVSLWTLLTADKSTCICGVLSSQWTVIFTWQCKFL